MLTILALIFIVIIISTNTVTNGIRYFQTMFILSLEITHFTLLTFNFLILLIILKLFTIRNLISRIRCASSIFIYVKSLLTLLALKLRLVSTILKLFTIFYIFFISTSGIAHTFPFFQIILISRTFGTYILFFFIFEIYIKKNI